MAASPSSLFTLEQAGIYRSGRWLVRGVDLSLSAGEIVTLVGPNGSGKSTTAKMALGILRPDEGAVRRRAGLVVSYVPQKVSVDWTLPLHVSRFMHLTGKVSEDEARRAMDATGIAHLHKAEVRTLSGGEFQRVLLARAIARK
ncbi:MAG: ATP-binding cassette domain-containing protein, partial [Notoacmeibacter sp.]|nr:ATP-binding cassette domain-containing protein [Notoacmeibacter sp.]